MNNDRLTLGRLFDGSGGFPLGGVLCGIEPVFASEIEPFPIRMTTKRFPNMIHFGDVIKLNGAVLSSKPWSDSRIVKWLQNPYSDSASYKMWGNGVALPNVCFVLAGIVYFSQNKD